MARAVTGSSDPFRSGSPHGGGLVVNTQPPQSAPAPEAPLPWTVPHRQRPRRIPLSGPRRRRWRWLFTALGVGHDLYRAPVRGRYDHRVEAYDDCDAVGGHGGHRGGGGIGQTAVSPRSWPCTPCPGMLHAPRSRRRAAGATTTPAAASARRVHTAAVTSVPVDSGRVQSCCSVGSRRTHSTPVTTASSLGRSCRPAGSSGLPGGLLGCRAGLSGESHLVAPRWRWKPSGVTRSSGDMSWMRCGRGRDGRGRSAPAPNRGPCADA